LNFKTHAHPWFVEPHALITEKEFDEPQHSLFPAQPRRGFTR
jgi:hypothetical protein